MTITEMSVHMDCAGCETNIRKALQKLKGVHNTDVDMFMQKVTVMGWADPKKVLKAVRSTGKKAKLWTYPYDPQYDNNSNNNNYDYNIRKDKHPSMSPIMDSTMWNNRPRLSSLYDNGGYDFDYYQRQRGIYPMTAVEEQITAAFSDENPHACSIM